MNNYYGRLPTAYSSFTFQTSTAHFLTFEGGFLNGLFSYEGAYYRVDPRFSATFAGFDTASDNDDNDRLVGNREPNGSEIAEIADENGNGVIDWKEDELVIRAVPSVFLQGGDFNHNNTEDIEEDDNIPEFLYGVDIQGFRGKLSISLDNFFGAYLKVSLGMLDEESISTGRKNQDYYIQTEYRLEETFVGTLFAGIGVHVIQDNIINDVNDELLQDLTYISRRDIFLFEDSFRFRFALSQSKNDSPFYGVDNYFFVDFNDNAKLLNNYRNIITLSRVRITIPIVSSDYAELRNYAVYSREAKNNYLEDPLFTSDLTRFSFLSVFVITPKSPHNLSLGYQYLDSISGVNDDRNFHQDKFTLQWKLQRGNSRFFCGFSFSSSRYRGSDKVRVEKELKNPRDDLRIYARLIL